MARGINKVILIGNLGADPETRYLPSGGAVTNVRLATSESWRDRNTGERKERTEWHRVTVWGSRGEGLAKILDKGSKILVEGRLQTSSYEKEGQKHYSTEIVATNICLAGGGGARDNAASAKPAAPKPASKQPEDWG